MAHKLPRPLNFILNLNARFWAVALACIIYILAMGFLAIAALFVAALMLSEKTKALRLLK